MIKNSPFILLVLLTLQGVCQISTEWSEPQVVAEIDPENGFQRPRIAVTESGAVNIVWAEIDGSGIQVMHSRKDGDSFSAPTILNNSDIELWNTYGPNIAAKGEEVYVVFENSPTSTAQISTRKSSDGGIFWNNEVEVDEFLFGDFATHPHVAIDGEGHPHASMIRYNGNIKDVGAICSVNNGVSYTAFINADDDVPGTLASPPFIIIDEDRHVVVWKQLDVSEQYFIYAALSTNNGASFADPVIMNDVVNPGAFIDLEDVEGFIRNDSLFLVWTSFESTQSIRLGGADLNDLSGNTWSVNYTELQDPSTSNDNPTIAGNSDYLGFIWEHAMDDNIDLMGAIEFDTFTFNPEPLFEDPGNRNSPSLAFQNGFHLTYIDQDRGAIMYTSKITNNTGVSEVVENNMLIYPNPAGNTVTINHHLKGEFTWRLTNVSGVEIQSGKDSGNVDLYLSDIPTGLYMIEIEQGDILLRKKIIRK